jgi:methylmalonyl-CoA mutase N-terminal domain/subunit
MAAHCPGRIVVPLVAVRERETGLALAERTGIDPKKFGLILTNESLMEFACRGTQFTTPDGHFRLSADVSNIAQKLSQFFTSTDLRLSCP